MPAQLDYAKRPSVVRRRWFRRAVVGVMIACLAASGVWWLPPAWRRGRLLYVQRQCLQYTTRPSELICAEPPPYAGETPPFTVAVMDPACLLELGRSSTLTTGRGPVLFLHERRSKAGVRRLIVVRRTPPGQRMSWDIPMSFNISLIEPAGLSGIPVARYSYYPDAVPSHFGDGSTNGPLLRFFAGQPDPADESHFTIDYEVDGERGTIDGWLRDTHDEKWPVGVELGQR
jgi:hypothetical protein